MYIGITLVLGFAAVNTGNNLLFLVVSGLLAFMSVTGLAGMYNLKGLRPELVIPEEIFAGTETCFRIKLYNVKTYLPSYLVRVDCSDGRALIPFIPRDSVSCASLTLVFPRRGETGAGRITISSTFPVNFFTRYWNFDQNATFIVFPKLRPGAFTGDDQGGRRVGDASLLKRGLDGELERISPYSGIEQLRMIHWKLSARSDELLVKQLGRQTAPPLLIDLAQRPEIGLEERISNAAWLVKRWVGQRPVGLIVAGHVIAAGSGGTHGRRLLKELALYDAP